MNQIESNKLIPWYSENIENKAKIITSDYFINH